MALQHILGYTVPDDAVHRVCKVSADGEQQKQCKDTQTKNSLNDHGERKLLKYS